MDRKSCTCDDCRSGCERKPGWFAPGQVEKVAQYLGLSLKELFAKYLMVDYWGASDELKQDIFLLAPAIVGHEPGTEYPADPHGTCVFFKDGLCAIHSVKPFECRMSFHTDGTKRTEARHKKIAKAWMPHQAQISSLLGREPELPNPFDMLIWGLGSMATAFIPMPERDDDEE